MDLEALLVRGYFPRELPPTFTTEKFAEVVAGSWGLLPPAFKDPTRR